MIRLAIVSFLIAATLGAFFAYRHLSGRPPNVRWAALHGMFVLGGLGTLITAALHDELSGNGAVALTLFFLAAVVGVMLVTMHIIRQPLPHWLIVMHGSTAAFAFVLLVLAQFGIV